MINIDELLSDVASREKCQKEDIEWYAWPQAFPTTAGPSGVGGCMISTFQVIAFDPPTGNKQMFCGGKWRRWTGEYMERWY